jgi:hypothetical protein
MVITLTSNLVQVARRSKVSAWDKSRHPASPSNLALASAAGLSTVLARWSQVRRFCPGQVAGILPALFSTRLGCPAVRGWPPRQTSTGSRGPTSSVQGLKLSNPARPDCRGPTLSKRRRSNSLGQESVARNWTHSLLKSKPQEVQPAKAEAPWSKTTRRT